MSFTCGVTETLNNTAVVMEAVEIVPEAESLKECNDLCCNRSGKIPCLTDFSFTIQFHKTCRHFSNVN